MAGLPVTALLISRRSSAGTTTPSAPTALEAGFERVYLHLASLGDGSKETPIVLECRGRREDRELELAFRGACDGNNALGRALPFRPVMIPKAANSVGLQMADLIARPVGLKHFRSDQPNRAYEIVEEKFRRSPEGKIAGWGFKVIP
ncbi:MAG: DUF3800 domain-containing protein [Verrucomicrobiota bacterium]|nr:DUF3800 domain-containing protein [Verrucomicrobiota bacterium]